MDRATLIHAKSAISFCTPSEIKSPCNERCKRYLKHITTAVSVISTLRAC